MPLDLEQLKSARRILSRYLPPTPLFPSPSLQEVTGGETLLKLELFQPIRTFKVRGALVKCHILRRSGWQGPVIAASAGNHGMGVAYAARLLGQKATIFVPRGASPAKLSGITSLGAQVVEMGQTYQEAFERAFDIAQKEDVPFVHAFDDPWIVAGQGTIGLELADKEFDEVYVPMGGGGLISGVGLALKLLRPEVKVIGVGAKASPAMARALKKGELVKIPIPKTIADGLTPRVVCDLTLSIARTVVDEVVEVDDDLLVRAMGLLLERERLLVEPSGAAPLAACLARPPQGRAALILSGGNISFDQAVKLLKRRERRGKALNGAHPLPPTGTP